MMEGGSGFFISSSRKTHLQEISGISSQCWRTVRGARDVLSGLYGTRTLAYDGIPFCVVVRRWRPTCWAAIDTMAAIVMWRSKRS